jgi:mRNA-degrading endonuclease toxin of MazEF toxin-antitoxin module
VRRGEVWWATLDPPLGHRPVLLVSRDTIYGRRTSVTVVPITTRIRNLPVEVRLGRREGLLRPSVANTDNLTSVSVALLQHRLGELGKTAMRQVDEAIHHALGLSY